NRFQRRGYGTARRCRVFRPVAMSTPYIGLTWDHPRGYAALQAAAKQTKLISWHTQALEGFESACVADMCAANDIIVLDHPHLGEAIADDCLQPLDAVFDSQALAHIAAASAGPSYASYNFAGRQWALPLDAATQVMALRDDLLDKPAPQTWDEVIALAQSDGGIALSLAGPHALLSLLSIAAALDPDSIPGDGGRWLHRSVASEAWRILAAVAAHAVP